MDTEFDRLNRELIAAREAYHKAHDEAKRVFDMLMDLEVHSPDGVASVKAARRASREAWNKYQALIDAYLAYRARR